MAHLASAAVGGYYPTPDRLLPMIASRLGLRQGDRHAFLDPCAGEGAALVALVLALYSRTYPGLPPKDFAEVLKAKAKVYAIEMEETRAQALGRLLPEKFGYGASAVTVEGDAFTVTARTDESHPGADLLYLNPPYDHDREFARLEERFLARFTEALTPKGILVFVVPYYALAASARTLGCHYHPPLCLKFPAPEWDGYKQVVLFARKRDAALFEPDPVTLERVKLWSTDPNTIPELTAADKPNGVLPPQRQIESNTWKGKGSAPCEAGFASFAAMPLDESRLAGFKLWHMTGRSGKLSPVKGFAPEPDAQVLFPMTMPPKPAHIAAGVAAGVFNGEEIRPDDPNSKAPPLLIKGVFDREFVDTDEKTNKDGEVVGVIQTQQPRLVVTVLDLKTYGLHTVIPSVELSGTTDPATMTTGDILTIYGKSLLKVLRAHCPVMYDPANTAHHFPLPTLARPLFTAQAHAVRALVTALGGPNASASARRDAAVVFLGELGVGKSQCGGAAALACGARRILVMCPPHLLQGWADQWAAFYPDARVVVLKDVKAVDAFAALDDSKVNVGILSREAAKLGHGWAPIGPLAETKRIPVSCPKCGAEAPGVDLVKTRARCEHAPYIPTGPAAPYLVDLATAIARLCPDSPRLGWLLDPRRGLSLYLAKARKDRARAKAKGKTHELEAAALAAVRGNLAVRRTVEAMAQLVVEGRAGTVIRYGDVPPAAQVLFRLLAGLDDRDLTADIIHRMYLGSILFHPERWGAGEAVRGVARELLYLLPGSPKASPLAAVLKALDKAAPAIGHHEAAASWKQWAARYDQPREGDRFAPGEAPKYMGAPLGDPGHFEEALESLVQLAHWTKGPECGERLYQAVAEPLRYPLATYIARRHPEAVDFVLLDEGHEYATEGSAQERAAHRLTELPVPTILLTGSIMNGYAESLFANWWALFRSFRAEFGRSQKKAFVERYGYRKRMVQDVGAEGKVVAYGSMTDRVERREKDLGNAPGVLPLFVLRMLANAVVLHKSDLDFELPPVRDIQVVVEPAEEQNAAHTKALEALVHQIKADRFTPLAGKLWGMMAEIPSHLDRCTPDTGNCKGGDYEIRYPNNPVLGVYAGRVIHTAKALQGDVILPKEKALLDTLAAEFAEGRRVCIFSWHVELLPRLARLILGRFGVKVPILDPSKVSASARQAWIDKHVVAPGAVAMLTNPVCVQTGLNNLVHFSSSWWHENPACNAIIFRQANGRFHRIGQKAPEVRTYLPRYAVRSQEGLHQLLLHKTAVSLATDGLDADSALQAAGVGETGVTSTNVGQHLYKILAEAA